MLTVVNNGPYIWASHRSSNVFLTYANYKLRMALTFWLLIGAVLEGCSYVFLSYTNSKSVIKLILYFHKTKQYNTVYKKSVMLDTSTLSLPIIATFLLLSGLFIYMITCRKFQKTKTKEDKVGTRYEPSGMPILPLDVVQYSQIPKSKTFTATTIPKGLLNRHNTKAGTWGIIDVQHGKLQYTTHEPFESVHVVDPTHRGVIEPTKYHEVKALTEDLEFVVRFYRLPGTGPVVEKREGYKED